ncbi:MAG: zinc ABC transporter substrate-binding protein [Magnetococcales bacterium]|nr:zinc ABC transporter substrate-binding protein [Magnetococcales bacterium]MBF0437837.1 zinc ABC transporter substrate-binding protein [Magnetococcales bacterium]
MFLIGGLLLFPGRVWALEVVVSIKPLHSLAAAVMGNLGSPGLLIQGSASEHTYTLRPSDARLLAKAKVIFWGGPTLETFLVRPLENLATAANKVAILEVEGLTRLPIREGGAWEKEEEDHHDHETHGPMDPHMWLDPVNAGIMGKAMARVLGKVDPANAGKYSENASLLSQRLEEMDQQLRRELTPVRDRHYIVFHDAYQYFERRYGLGSSGSVMVNPDLPPSVRRIEEIGKRIVASKAVCLFTEPQFSARLAETVAAGQGIRIGVLDPLGAAMSEGPDLYFQLLRGLSKALVACLRSE